MVLGGIILLLVAEAAFLTAIALFERPLVWIVPMIATALALDWVFSLSIFKSVVENPILALELFLTYVGIGVAWSFPKWWFYVRKIKNQYVAALEEFKLHKGIPSGQKLTDAEVDHFYSSVWYDSRQRWFDVIPVQVSKNKEKVLSWMISWPLSLFLTMMDEPLKKLFGIIFEMVKSVYQKISDVVFSDVEYYQPKKKG